MRKRFKIKNLIRNNRYAFLSRGEEKNLLANEMSLQILGGGQLCGSNELTPTRISKFAGSLRNSALPLGEGQTKSGERSPLLHTGHPRKSNMPFYVIPQRERMRQAGIVTLRDLKRKLVRDDDLTGDVKSHSDLIK